VSTINAAASGISAQVDRARKQRGQVLTNEGDVRLKEYPRYSIQKLAAGATATDFLFFQDAANSGKMVTNLPQSGQVVSSGIFRCTAIGFHVDAEGSASDEVVAAATSIAAAQLKVRAINGGWFALSVGDRKALEDYGLFKYPSGGGVFGFASNANDNSTTVNNTNVVGNGFPSAGNLRRIVPIDITSKDAIKLDLSYRTALVAPANVNLYIMCTLYGDLLQDAAA